MVLLKLRGVLKALNSPALNVIPLADDVNAELNLLSISKIDSVTHNNMSWQTIEAQQKLPGGQSKINSLWMNHQMELKFVIKFLCVKFREDTLEVFVTDMRVAIKKLVKIGIDLPQDILAYLILFKLPDTLQLLKQQIMHFDKSLTVQLVCNHLTQFSNKNKADVREHSSSTQAALVSTRNQKSNQPNDQKGGQGSSGAER
ncbi:hypothetical protein MJO28_011115 [Puccinia striiformis f. sp. tritici]|uniref:Uncharacterized protein n=2 Tax=Puccinia striiformis TaxID=27350 RepID=A0A2S4VC53_9BASI|nr:hypothetical protein MJO28_011115 [Puccinia striiformis f. sp. tritici]KAI7946375.1 hypothetical protein MJO29_010902 [Puccinia striiformis f. sp. tritici]POW07112.1 hypothetical protein PSTT_08485 [Puccinia striiformis]